MESTDEIRDLLREIRDTQREYLAEYRRVTERLAALLTLLVYLLARYSRQLFGI